MEFSIPPDASPQLESQLTRLVNDFHDGYLTERGYLIKRVELLELNAKEEIQPNSSNSNLSTGLPILQTTRTVTSTSNTNSDFLTDDFFQPINSNTIDSSSNNHPVFYDEETFERYNNMRNYQNMSIRKELQKPLDPRDVTIHIETDTNNAFDNLAMILRKRARLNEKEPALLLIDERGREDKVITWDKIYYRAEKIAKQIKNKAALYPGDRVCLIYQNVEIIDFMVALYGCFLSGVVAVPLNSSIPTKDLVAIMKDTQSHLCLVSDSVFKHFEKLVKQSKSPIWPKSMNIWKTSDMGTYKPSKKDGDSPLNVSDLAYIDYTKNTTGEYKGVVISHRTIINQMKMLDKILSTSPDIKLPLVRSSLKPSYSKNTIVSTLDSRSSIGLAMSMLFSVYSGNLLVWIQSKIAEVPGLFANMLTTYKASVILTDYFTLKSVAFNYQSFPQSTKNFSKRKVDLSYVKWCLIDTFIIDCEFNEILSERWFKPLGNKNSKRIISPILSLNEHGGAIVSMRDWYGNEDQLGCIFMKNSKNGAYDEDNDDNDDINEDNKIGVDDENGDGDDDYGFVDDDSKDKLSEVIIDKDSLCTNSVKVINDSPPNYSSYDSNNSKYVRVGSFGYPLPDATLALVNPETKTLSGVLEVGEIWVDSNCISGGYWGLPEDTENIFQAECSDYEGILSLKFVRTGLLGFIYNGKIYVLGLYEDRINQRVTWYDQYLEISNEETRDKEVSEGHNRNSSMASDLETYYKNQRKKVHKLDSIDLSQNLYNKYIYKYHYSNHLVKSLAVNLPEFRDCAFFNLQVNKEYLPVGIMESFLADNKTKSAQVELQAMLSEAFEILEKNHNVRLFFMVVTVRGSLSRSMKNGRMEIANTLTKRQFLEGRLSSVYVYFKPYNSLGSIYHGDDLMGGIWSPYSTSIRSEMLSYATFQSSGLDKRDSSVEDRSHKNLTDFRNPIELLEFRASKQPDELAFVQLEGVTIRENKQLTTWKKIESKIFSICVYLLEKKVLVSGDAVILMYPLCEEYIICLFACWMAGYIVIPMTSFTSDIKTVDEDVEKLVTIIKDLRVKAIFVNNDTETALKNRPISSKLKDLALKKGIIIPKLRNTSKHSKTSSNGKSTYKIMEQYRKTQSSATINEPYTVWLSSSDSSNYKCIKVTSNKLMCMCLSLKETCQMNGTAPLIGCCNFTQGLGFLMSSVMGVYTGATTYLMSKSQFAFHSGTFFQAIERYRIENVYLDSKMFSFALKRNSMDKINLKTMKNLMLSWQDERPDPLLLIKNKEQIELSNIKVKNICNVFEHHLNPLVTTRSFLAFEPVVLWLDPHALSQGYISIVNPKDSPTAIPIVDSGIVSVNTEIVIINPQTEQLCRIGEFGEIWVSSDSTADGYVGKDNNKSTKEFLNGKLAINDKKYLRTGKFGFLHRVNKTEKNKIVEMQLLYDLGNIDETFEYCGLQFFAKDIEHCMETFDGIGQCCVFKAGEYTVLLASTETQRSLSTITPLMTLKLLNQFKFVIDIISFIDVGDLDISIDGRIQRKIIANKFMNQKLNIKASFGVSYGENEMTKVINMQEWVEANLSKIQ